MGMDLDFIGEARASLKNYKNVKFRYGLVSCLPAMERVYEVIESLAKNSFYDPILIRGESGTGKDLVANAIHKNSERKSGRFIAISCANLPKDILESELFGHKKGSFTGAISDREGKAKAADGGTLFLDEIGEMDLAVQPKFLRFLDREKEYREVYPVGSDDPVRVNVRVVVATSRDLEKMTSERTFYEPLLNRVYPTPLVLPPLRERRGDIVLLAEYFLFRLKYDSKSSTPSKDGLEKIKLDERALWYLSEQEWPGNVRQLKRVIETAVAIRKGDVITEDAVKELVNNNRPDDTKYSKRTLSDAVRHLLKKGYTLNLAVWELELSAVIEALRITNRDKKEAAKRLGISLSEFNGFLRKLTKARNFK